MMKRRLINHKGKIFVQRYKLTVPKVDGVKSSLAPSDEAPKGMLYDCGVWKLIVDATKLEVTPVLHTQADQLEKLAKHPDEEYDNITCVKYQKQNLEEQTT